MSNLTDNSIDRNTLLQRLQSSEKSIEFIQREHSTTLANLHDEISKWQQKCSDLTFQLAIGGATIVQSRDEEKLRSSVEQLEKELKKCKETISNLTKLLEEKEKSIVNYESQLIINERKYKLDLQSANEKQRKLREELEQRSTLIAQLTNQLYRERQQSTFRQRASQNLLPDKPKILKPSEETNILIPSDQRSSSLNRRRNSEDESIKTLLAARRPPTPPQQLRPISPRTNVNNDEQQFSKRQLQLLNNHLEKNDSNSTIVPTRSSIKLANVLPPIVNRKVQLKPLTNVNSTSNPIPQEGEV